MDRWSVDEMHALKAKCYPALSLGDYNDLLKLYGPIPRWALEQTSTSHRDQWKTCMEKALSATDLEKSLASVINGISSADDSAVSHIVIHQAASSDFMTCTYSIASVWVGERVCMARVYPQCVS